MRLLFFQCYFGLVRLTNLAKGTGWPGSSGGSTGWTGTHSASHNRCRERDLSLSVWHLVRSVSGTKDEKLKRLPPDDENAERIQEQSLWPGWKNVMYCSHGFSGDFRDSTSTRNRPRCHMVGTDNMHLRLQLCEGDSAITILRHVGLILGRWTPLRTRLGGDRGWLVRFL